MHLRGGAGKGVGVEIAVGDLKPLRLASGLWSPRLPLKALSPWREQAGPTAAVGCLQNNLQTSPTRGLWEPRNGAPANQCGSHQAVWGNIGKHTRAQSQVCLAPWDLMGLPCHLGG